MCLLIETTMEAEALLALFHRIEADMGRERLTRWGQRVIDIDLLTYGDQVLPDTTTVQHWIDLPLEVQKTKAPRQLLLPHPRIQDRGFVLVPMAEVAPDWTHPVLGKTVTQMLEDLPRADIRDIHPL